MTRLPLLARLAVLAGVGVVAASATGASTLTVIESAPNVPVPSGLFSDAPASGVYFGGMYSPQGNPRGFAMGYVDLPPGVFTNNTLVLAFGLGPRIVARAAGPVKAGSPRPIAGGTGKYLGMRGVERNTRKGSTYTHTLTYTLPPKGTVRVREDYMLARSPAVTITRGGAGGVGDTRDLTATLRTPAGQLAGTYTVSSVLMHSYSGGLYQWYVGDATYTFTDGSTLRVIGPFQRATGTAPGVLNPSPRVVLGGTGRYAGMRGQVVITPQTDGSSLNSFTLIK